MAGLLCIVIVSLAKASLPEHLTSSNALSIRSLHLSIWGVNEKQRNFYNKLNTFIRRTELEKKGMRFPNTLRYTRKTCMYSTCVLFYFCHSLSSMSYSLASNSLMGTNRKYMVHSTPWRGCKLVCCFCFLFVECKKASRHWSLWR